MDMYIARQPIFNTEKQIFGYELSFRSDLDFMSSDHGDTTDYNPMDTLFFPFEPTEILDNKPGLINFTETQILQKAPLLFPKDQIIIAAQDGIQPIGNIMSTLSMFNDEGYTIALDHEVCRNKSDALIKKSKIVKFDLRLTPINLLLESIEAMKSEPDIQLMAKKVENYKDFEMALALGFSLFQGYFFSTPVALISRTVAPNQFIKLKLINEIEKNELDFKIIETLIKNDAPLSFKLLKYINSAYYRRPVTINTVKDALVYLGEKELRKFIHIVVISEIGENKPNELVRTSITRAGMLERCASIFNSRFSKDELFMLGLFSLMDALMDCRMKDILKHISFSDKMKNALLGKDKKFKILLKTIIGFERGQWENPIFKKIEESSIETKLPEFYFESIRSANAFYDS